MSPETDAERAGEMAHANDQLLPPISFQQDSASPVYYVNNTASAKQSFEAELPPSTYTTWLLWHV